MSNNPETRGDKTRGKTVQGPEGKAGEGIEDGRRKRDTLRGQESFEVNSGLVNDTDEEEVPDAV